MPLSAREVYDAAQLTPAFFGTAIDFSGMPQEQEAQALAYIKTEVLPGAEAEVSVPVREVLVNFSVALDDDGITLIFGTVAVEVLKLWNFAVLSFARSELNKRVASSLAEYDKDSDQDRIQGNQRLQKLIAFVQTWRDHQTRPTPTWEETLGFSSSERVVVGW